MSVEIFTETWANLTSWTVSGTNAAVASPNIQLANTGVLSITSDSVLPTTGTYSIVLTVNPDGDAGTTLDLDLLDAGDTARSTLRFADAALTRDGNDVTPTKWRDNFIARYVVSVDPDALTVDYHAYYYDTDSAEQMVHLGQSSLAAVPRKLRFLTGSTSASAIIGTIYVRRVTDIIIGDSLATGTGEANESPVPDGSGGKVEYSDTSLRGLAQAAYPDRYYLNMGLGGRTTQHPVDQLSLIAAMKPSRAVIWCGTNDIFLSEDMADIQSRITTIISTLVAAGIQVTWFNTAPRAAFNSTQDAAIATLNAWLATNVPALGGTVIDAYTALVNPSDATTILPLYHDGGGTHLSDEGNEAVAREYFISQGGGMISDPVLYWKFDGNPNASVGGADFTVTGTASYEAGTVGQHIALTGAADLDAGDVSAMDVGDGEFTVAGWYTMSDITPSANVWLFDKKNKATGSTAGINFRVTPGGALIAFIADGSLNSFTFATLSGSGIGNGDAFHVALVRTDSNLLLYINAVNVGSTPSTDPATIGSVNNAHDLTIDVPSGETLDVDDLRFYDRALTAQDVAELYGYRGAGAGKTFTAATPSAFTPTFPASEFRP